MLNMNNSTTDGASIVKGVISLALLALACWWVYDTFIKTDYSKPWWQKGESSSQLVVWCEDGYCPLDDHQYTLPVHYYATEEDIHYFEISMPNGGYVDTVGRCDQAAKGAYYYDRFCTVFSDEGEKFMIAPTRFFYN